MRLDLCRTPSPTPLVLADALEGGVVSYLLARGAREVLIAPGPKVAGLLKEGRLLLGESEGFPLEGAFARPSLLDLEGAPVAGQSLVLVAPSLNLSLHPEDGEVYLGSFRNALALLEALGGRDLTLRPAGAPLPLLSALVVAGFLLKRLYPETPANLATALLKVFPDPQEALFQSPEGQALHRQGRTEELARASLIGVDGVVPRLDGVLPFPKKAYGLSQDRWVYRFTPWSA